MNSDSPDPSPIVVLPSELENEPFSTHDTGVRSEINHINQPRALFHCRMRESHGDITIVCNVNGVKRSMLSGMSSFYRSQYSTVTVRWKMSTQISMLDVYDNYGLSVVIAYIDRLLSSDIARHQPVWVAAYLVVSLEIVDSGPASESSQLWTGIRMQSIKVSEVIDRARTALISYMTVDSRSRSHAPDELTSIHVELPIELLARIINSIRVSKEIAKLVTQTRLARELLPGEMSCYASRPHTQKPERSGFCLISKETMWLLRAGDAEFQLERLQTPQIWGIGDDCVFSPSDVALVRGVSIRAAFDGALNSNDIDLVCGWIVQLSYELDSTVEMTMNKDELLLYYDTLVRRARGLWK